VTLSGGEVTIRKDILEILEFIKTAGFKINIQTNARKFSNEEFTKQVSKIGIENFLISFHGHNKDLFENITKVEGSFDETISGIINLKKHNQSIISNIVVSKLNYYNLYDIVSLLCKLNIDAIKFVYIRAFGYAKERYLELCPSFNECTDYLSEFHI
jgi:MoaA/NifB/PqqE/SkfB family radical SAM enzyme